MICYIRSQLKKYISAGHGNAAVEFALILPVLALLTIPVLDFGLVVINKVKVKMAISSGILASLEVTSLTSEILAAIEDSTSLNDPTITVTQSCQCSDNSIVACDSFCGGAQRPEDYYEITLTGTIDLIGTYGFISNPFPIEQTYTVMVP